MLQYTPSDTSAMKYTIIIDKYVCDGGGRKYWVGGGKLVIEVLTLTQTRDRFKTFLDYLRVVLNDNSH